MHRLLLVLLAAVAWAGEADSSKLPVDAQAAVDKAEKAIAGIQAKADAEIGKIRQGLIITLTKTQTAVTKKGDLDGANAVKAKIDALEKLTPDLLGADPPATAPAAKGWASITISSPDTRFSVAPAKVGTVAILDTVYEYTAVPQTKPEAEISQTAQHHKGPFTVTVTTPGRMLVFGGMAPTKLLEAIPKEAKPSASIGEISAPGIMSCVSCTVKTGMTFSIEGMEIRFMAGKISSDK